MATEKRERQRANRQLKAEEQQREERRDQVRSYGYIAAIVGVLVVAALALFALAGGDDEPATETEAAADGDAAEDASADESTEEAATEAEPAAEPLPCPAEDGSSAQVLEFPAPPPDCLVEGASYTAVFDTTAGEIVAELDAETAPVSVNNFVYLARYHYYDDTLFHRVIEDFVIQGGDPVGEPAGTGTPGYNIGEEPPEPGGYEVGSLAMAKRSAPNTTGAQFFIITGEDGAALPNQYSLFGQVTEGLDVATQIQTVETGDADRPVDDVIVNSITILQS